ncbi:F-box/fbd/LRR-repeat protein [Abeliophyllum distichum]|uniref:F-box/fbd/LRR-repeat protein n=1 Tax=Abeliophyllum distichum TaxID=126358 RepID=A0ABD1V2L5_9LAMI
MDNILMHLTIRDAVKTSILSKQWRYKWANLPQLIFDDKLWQELERNWKSARIKFTSILYQVLLFHRGPITKFALTIPELRSCSEIDHLIYFLSKNDVKEFTFKIQKGHKLSSLLFMCLQLKHLSLSSCLIYPPPSFKGFNRLIMLELDDVTIEAEVLIKLISSCPLLEQLVLRITVEFDYLEIDAPMLKLFELKCVTTSVSFKKSPLLEMVSVAADENVLAVGDEFCNFVEFLESVPSLQKLHMSYHFTKLLVPDEIQTMLPFTLNNLKILELSAISLYSLEELSSVLCLIKSSPNLEKLKIEMFAEEVDHATYLLDFLKVQDYSNVLLSRLQEVTLIGIAGTVPEMTLIKLLLEKSSTLKRMVISSKFYKCDDKLVGTLKELNKFLRASPNAEVKFEERIQQ